MSDHAVMTGSNSSSAKTLSTSGLQTETITSSEISSLFQRALALHQQNCFEEAESLYRRILDAEPNHPGTLHGFGLIHLQRGEFQKACEYFEKAIVLCPTKAVYRSNYGVALLKQGKKNEAQAALEKALDICPDHPDALYNFGLVQFEQQNHGQASQLWEQLLERCDYPQAIPKLIESLCKQKCYEKALHVYIHHRNSHKIPLGMMDHIASIFHQSKQYDYLIRVTKDAVVIGGEAPHRSHYLAWGYGDCGNFIEAKRHYANAAAQRPGRPMWKHKHLNLCPTVFVDNREIEHYWNELNRSLDEAIALSPAMELCNAFKDGVMPSFNLPHLMLCCREVKEKFATLIRPSFREFQPPEAGKTGKIRVGFFVSGGHQGGCLRSDTGLMKRLDRKRFEPVFITGRDVIDQCKCAIRSDDVEYVGISADFEEAVREIRAAKCHILYHWQTCSDLMNYLMPFARCAPVQIAGFGMHGTTGTREIDYFMSSKYLEPPDGDKHYTENMIRCDELATWQDRIEIEKFQGKRNDFGLPEKDAIYFCPHRLPKFHPNFDRLLRDILEKDRRGHLVILDGGNKHAVKKLHDRWEKTLGKSIMSRIVTLPQMAPFDYYKLISVSSCILDSPCYSTSFTGFDALALGVPLIGLQGKIMVQRYASAFYKRMHLEEFIPRNRKEYVTLAVTVANDRDFRRHFIRLVDERKEVLVEHRPSVHCFEEVLERIHAEAIGSG